MPNSEYGQNEQTARYRKRLFVTREDDSLLQSTSTQGNYLDENQLICEETELVTNLTREMKRLKTVNKVNLPPFEKVKLIDSQRRLHGFVKLFHQNSELIESSQKSGTLTLNQLKLYNLISTGAVYLAVQEIDKQFSLAQNRGQGEKMEKFSTLQKQLLASHVLLKHLNISLEDFANQEKFLSLNKVDAYRFLADNMLTRINGSFDERLKALDIPIAGKYPNITKKFIDTSTVIVWALLDTPLELIQKHLRQSSGLEKESAGIAIDMLERVNLLRSNLLADLANPQSENFPALKNTINVYLKKDKNNALYALHVLGLNEVANIYLLYRFAQRLMRDNVETHFYSSLCAFIEEMAAESGVDILTKDDLDAITEPLQNEADISAKMSPADLGKTVSSIFSLSSIKQYTLAPDTITWQGLVQPQNVVVRFDQNKPKFFSIECCYSNDTGEKQSLVLYIDTRKNQFDWNILDEPYNLPGMYQIVLKAADAVLKNVLDQSRDYHVKRRSEQEKPVCSKPTIQHNTERVIDEIYQLRKQVRADSKKPNQANISMFNRPVSENPSIKNSIQLPKDTELVKLLKGISTVDQEIVLKGIDNFNLMGLGTFKMLSNLAESGQPLYSLRINSTVRGGIRILLKEDVSEQSGQRKFEVIDIGYRKDIYRR